MNRVLTLLAGLALGGCVSLPGSDDPAQKRFDLLPATSTSCPATTRSLDLSVAVAASGLANNRIALRHADSGEIEYLAGGRWAEPVTTLVRNRLASDLECNGYSVSSGHQRNLARDTLDCEIRDFSLHERAGSRSSHVSLSCHYRGAGDSAERTLLASASSPVQRWSLSGAVAAFSQAWTDTSGSLSRQLHHSGAN